MCIVFMKEVNFKFVKIVGNRGIKFIVVFMKNFVFLIRKIFIIFENGV